MRTKTVYIEHSYLCKEENWPQIRMFFSENPHFKLVASDWSLIEIAQATDIEQAKRRVNFIQELNPLWLIIKTEIQKYEVKRFIYRYLFEYIYLYSVFRNTYFDAAILSLPPANYRTMTPLQVVESFMKDEPLFRPIKEQREKYIPTFQKLRGIGKKQIREKDDIIVSSWVKDVLPITNPYGFVLNEQDKAKTLDYCIKNKDKFFQECGYFNFENTLLDVRLSDTRRTPKESDSMDLEHICCSLPYCDYVVIGDRHLLHISNEANKVTNMGKLVACISHITN